MKYETFEKYRNKVKMTNKEVSEKTGLSQQYLFGWKDKQYNPNPIKIKCLCDLLNIPQEKLFER